jgi:predicted DCC family thiol-disulfide oxidoreductase YuxK
METTSGIVIVYDGDCPVCSRYVTMIRLRESVGSVALINARDGGEYVQKVRDLGLDLNEGMVAFYGGRVYHGADCVNLLAMLGSDSGVMNQLHSLLFKNASVARLSYPAMRFGRNTLLTVLGRSRI